MKKTFVTLALCSLVAYTHAQKIIQTESKVTFEIGNLGLSSVEGTIEGMKGTVKFDPASLSTSTFDVTVSPSTIDTDNDKRDEHLKNEDFFDVKKYLTIHFVSKEIKKKGNEYVAIGNLTILQTTKQIELPFTVTKEGSKTKFEGEIEVNRFDYNLAVEAYSGTFMVGETAEVKIICVVE